MLDNKLVFLFYALAVACFLLAALQSGTRPGLSRGALSRVALVPLGLALYVFPQMWNAAVAGF